MKITLFKKHVLITAAVTLVFMIIGLAAAFMVLQFEKRNFSPPAPVFVAKLIDRLVEGAGFSYEKALQAISEGSDSPLTVELVSRETVEAWLSNHPELEVPREAYDSLFLKEYDNEDDSPAHIVRLNSQEERFLKINMRPPPLFKAGSEDRPRQRSAIIRGGGPPPPHFMGPPKGGRMLWVNFIAITVAIFLASIVSLFFLFYSMRERASLARQVIDNLKKGNLKSRFPIKRVDEVGQLMVEFNHMADEIELLVSRIKAGEEARINLLQELAHDLRTPVASLKSMLETLHMKREGLDQRLYEELTSLSIKEIDYFARLVEDLLLLAQVTEPKYSIKKSEMDIVELIDGEIENIATRYSAMGRDIRFQREFPQPALELKCDPHLMKRLVRNALENAYSFAKGNVSVAIRIDDEPAGGFASIVVIDDGPGLSSEALAAFGEKRITRVITEGGDGRVSVGLGSVIMKAVVGLHEGKLSVRNLYSESGAIQGAEVTIRLKAA